MVDGFSSIFYLGDMTVLKMRFFAKMTKNRKLWGGAKKEEVVLKLNDWCYNSLGLDRPFIVGISAPAPLTRQEIRDRRFTSPSDRSSGG